MVSDLPVYTLFSFDIYMLFILTCLRLRLDSRYLLKSETLLWEMIDPSVAITIRAIYIRLNGLSDYFTYLSLFGLEV